ncbi:hypothetical protein Acr_08g0019030 [Actinidia rufa]|uniref:Uncharacterized protein n=1 Tax=Actinidia rufa TaxID=165716 RepID=A0A7J0F6G7_9ERIC|nr:hypothetical protein Acr_08g0019030 [Actinidia rufa]
MGTEEEQEPSSTPKLPLLSLPPIKSPERSGTLTPPLYTSASVPFRWEEEPGKPRPGTALLLLPTTTTTTTKGLELPPRLQSMDSKWTPKYPPPQQSWRALICLYFSPLLSGSQGSARDPLTVAAGVLREGSLVVPWS